MFESLREAFRQALENFNSEVKRDRVPEAADRLLRAMKSELVELQKQSMELESDLEAVREEEAKEHEAAKTCLRREDLARKIGDEETASLAREFAGRHLQRHEILAEKATVLTRELEERRANLEEMKGQFQEAQLRRESLAATAGRADTRDQIRRADDLFEEMDRFADRIRDLEANAQAAKDIGETLGASSPPSRDTPDEDDLEARLEALKRRMDDR